MTNTPNVPTENKPDLSEVPMLNEKYALNNTPNGEALKSCPFCGGAGHVFSQATFTGRGLVETTGVSCVDCKASVNRKIWNHRAISHANTEATALVEKLVGTLDNLAGACGSACKHDYDGFCMVHHGYGKPCAVETANKALAQGTAWLAGKKGDV